ncbi:MAG: RluA family pseudouridine synthase [Actinomycetota bacterium]
MTGPRRYEASAGRLDAVLAQVLDITRVEAQRMIAQGQVRVDGRERPKSFRLQGGEVLDADRAEGIDLPVEGPPVPIRYQDRYLLVVAKPAGLVTHPTATKRSGTLVNRLLGMDVPLSSAGGDALRPGIVHRLDAGTSGLLIVAKDDATHEAFGAMLKHHEIRRTYLTLVRGRVEHDRFAVDAPLGRHGSRVTIRSFTGREAETGFVALERFERATFLEATPKTGRTHQIRVHLSAIGHPILGDARYGGGGDDAKALGLTRPFLHAWRLAFEHPITGERVEVEEPLPEDLTSGLDRLGPGRPEPPAQT